MSTKKKLFMGVGMALGLMIPVMGAHAGLFDWLFGHKDKTTESTEALSVATLDSSSKWVCEVGGACQGGNGICCASGMKKHLKGMENIEAFEVDPATGLVTLTIKKGQEVKTSALQKAFGSHWSIKNVKPEKDA